MGCCDSTNTCSIPRRPPTRETWSASPPRVSTSTWSLNDPWFAWLRDLSQFVVLIDETLDFEEPPTPEEADKLIARARELVSPSENANGFARKYWEAMQRDPGVVLAHRDMVRVFSELQTPTER